MSTISFERLERNEIFNNDIIPATLWRVRRRIAEANLVSAIAAIHLMREVSQCCSLESKAEYDFLFTETDLGKNIRQSCSRCGR